MRTAPVPRLGHPRRVVLEAWFDGEGEDRVGEHVSACARCCGHLDEVARLRLWLRGDVTIGVDRSVRGGRPQRKRPGRRHLAAPLVVVFAALMFVLPSTARVPSESNRAEVVDRDGRVPGPDKAEPQPSNDSSSEGRRATAPEIGPETVTDDAPAARATDGATPKEGRSTGARPGPGATTAAGTGSAPVTGPLAASVPIGLRLGLVVPRSGAGAREGAEVERVVRARVDLANAAGGLNGWRVGLETVPAEDAAAVRELGQRVDAFVGGFGVATVPDEMPVPWLLPADPAIEGPTVVRAEPTPRRAGERLAEQLRADGTTGAIGVIVDGTDDAELADGIGSNAVRATAAGVNCDNEIGTLRQRDVTVIAVAAAPAWVARCFDSLDAAKFRPAHGVLVPPSAAYAGLSDRSGAAGVRSVLGLPWPTAPDTGGARFRSTTGSTSYRALVSFAAVELAVHSARSSGAGGSVGPAPGQRVETDLVHVTERGNDQTLLVVAGVAGWLAPPPRR